ncbi:MAG: GAF domain-containing protein [Armatimonadetes bacterium]|nr:GAF domain-containing protein [Armatimonadota bacterium]
MRESFPHRPEAGRVLLVDRDPQSQAVVAQVLEAEGHVVGCASGLPAAMACLRGGFAPDLVIVDYPTIGAEFEPLAVAIRVEADEGPIPFIVLVPEGDEMDPLADAGMGVGDLLVHPVQPDTLRRRVRALLRLKAFCASNGEDLRRLTEIALHLSSEQDLNLLLERIVEEAQAINHAEAGTLYTLDPDAGVLRYQILRNDRLGTRLGGASSLPLPLPEVPLDHSHVSSHVALTGEIINIPDVYSVTQFDFSGPRTYDALTGYRSHSMLVVPIRNRDGTVLGVLQLINSRRPGTGEIVPFLARNIGRTQALASQAGIAISNARLIHDLEMTFEGLLQVMAIAVDAKSTHTSGHIRRVTRLACMLAEAVNACGDARFGERRFTPDEIEELRIAGLLHDIGKIVVPEHLIDKATKLQTVFDRIELLRTRFDAIRRSRENQALRQQLEIVRRGGAAEELARVDTDLARSIAMLRDDLAFLETLNRGGERLANDRIERLYAIASQFYVDGNGFERPFLTEDEVQNLAITRGTLLPEELDQIRNHAAVTIRLLQQIPFARKFRHVPTYAGDHHEMLDGTGYPRGKVGEDLPLQSRILAVADIFDAITASDRPYRKADPYERACGIPGTRPPGAGWIPVWWTCLLKRAASSACKRRWASPRFPMTMRRTRTNWA